MLFAMHRVVMTRCWSRRALSSMGVSMGVFSDITGAIGRTPLVKLNRVVGDAGGNVYAKLEMQNPGGSVKDRIAVSMIEKAEARGDITPGKTTIVEMTSGNTGIGLAMVCAAKGYKCILVMPQLPGMMERYGICRKFGADVHLTAGAVGAPMVRNMETHMASLLASDASYWSPMQFSNLDNPAAHVEATAPEIWEQLGGRVDAFVAGAGTGGTIVGCGEWIKERNPSCRTVCVEPSESRVLAGNPPDKHSVVGIGAGVSLPFVELQAPGEPYSGAGRGAIDEFASAHSDEAVLWANRLAAEEGLLVGPSSGAACKVAVEVASRPEFAGKNIVVVFASSGIRYVTHPMWADTKAECAAILAPPPDFSNAEPLLRWKSEDFVPPVP